jgi:hypothetical protein
MFRALLSHPQEAQNIRHLVYCVGVLARNIPSAACAAGPKDEQVMLETCRGP